MLRLLAPFVFLLLALLIQLALDANSRRSAHPASPHSCMHACRCPMVPSSTACEHVAGRSSGGN